MDECDALRYIFGGDLEHYTRDTEHVYKISAEGNSFEFRCSEGYPNTIPEMSSDVEDNILAEVREETKKYISTPMIFDMVRIVVRKLEGSNIVSDVKRISISYNIDDKQKITEEDFMNWKKGTPRAEKPRTGKTGKEIFLERRRSKEDFQDDI
ncbi:uncharacterized protein Eint_091080 [Encephalitozoon intestinalis ATCC 50506]|uniref:RWD domain-containing protein n=1 Tax=Encephalitozoon intestinalis (strain ATCC 50506) TaxID=876142 RepID=E0S8X1_ENCIT|nr:uncharacterized protein Eint_091080 [Encephalitozoon intestinalis ATCC 50506]ADM12237.1 hypothetical protein Eint_091080 [Encephalitozoon intestinalis ATCC 50506]UTX46046.1 RWD domain-containing protein [Encephalitozoon intestinalis]